MTRPKALNVSSILLLGLYAAMFTGLVFSFRAVNSIAVGLLLPVSLINNKQLHGRFFIRPEASIFLYACTALFVWVVLSLSFRPPVPDDWRQLLIKTTLLIIPFAVCGSSYLSANTLPVLRRIFILIVTIGAVYCLSVAIINYGNDRDISGIFYHQLVSPLKQHAVYYSLLVFFSLLCLFEFTGPGRWVFSKWCHIAIAVFLAGFLVLLSSKLIIAFFIFYLLHFLFAGNKGFKLSNRFKIAAAILVIAGTGLVLLTRNPVSRRFDDLLQGQNALTTNTYRQDDYFNGLQFRLLQWKLVPAILSENKGWVTGVGAARSQNLLAREYIARNMYAGKPGSPDTGYLLYNTHNSLLETLLKYGIAGALLYIAICLALVKLAFEKKKRTLGFTVILLLLFTFTEAVLETQYGILIFTFFPLFFARE